MLEDYFPGSRSVAIPGRTFPVTAYFLEHALSFDWEHLLFGPAIGS